jgi:hypothetical protein
MSKEAICLGAREQKCLRRRDTTTIASLAVCGSSYFLEGKPLFEFSAPSCLHCHAYASLLSQLRSFYCPQLPFNCCQRSHHHHVFSRRHLQTPLLMKKIIL